MKPFQVVLIALHAIAVASSLTAFVFVTFYKARAEPQYGDSITMIVASLLLIALNTYLAISISFKAVPGSGYRGRPSPGCASCFNVLGLVIFIVGLLVTFFTSFSLERRPYGHYEDDGVTYVEDPTHYQGYVWYGVIALSVAAFIHLVCSIIGCVYAGKASRARKAHRREQQAGELQQVNDSKVASPEIDNV